MWTVSFHVFNSFPILGAAQGARSFEFLCHEIWLPWFGPQSCYDLLDQDAWKTNPIEQVCLVGRHQAALEYQGDRPFLLPSPLSSISWMQSGVSGFSVVSLGCPWREPICLDFSDAGKVLSRMGDLGKGCHWSWLWGPVIGQSPPPVSAVEASFTC